MGPTGVEPQASGPAQRAQLHLRPLAPEHYSRALEALEFRQGLGPDPPGAPGGHPECLDYDLTPLGYSLAHDPVTNGRLCSSEGMWHIEFAV